MSSLPFDVPSFVKALPAAVGVGRPLAGDWRIEEVGWGPDDAIEVQVGKGDGQGNFVRLLVRRRGDSSRVFRRTAHFDLFYVVQGDRGGQEHDEHLDLALRRLAGAIRWMDRPDVDWVWPAPRPPSAPAPSMARFERLDVMQLSIDSPCNSRCQFCTLATVELPRPVFDGAYHDGLVAKMRAGRSEGATVLSVAGYDPLTYPAIVPLARSARELGFGLVEFQTTGVPLADPELVDALVSALSPAKTRFLVPLYGATPEVHDAVTGRPGAFERVTAALAHLARAATQAHVEVTVTSVILPANIHEMGAARALTESLGFSFSPHLAFPSAGGRLTMYRQAAMRISDAVRQLHRLDPPLVVTESPPCILLRHERESGIPSLTKLHRGPAPLAGSHSHPRLPLVSIRAEEREESVTMPCPQAARCALASGCMQRIYRAYSEQFGLGEFEAVRAEEVPEAYREGP